MNKKSYDFQWSRLKTTKTVVSQKKHYIANPEMFMMKGHIYIVKKSLLLSVIVEKYNETESRYQCNYFAQ